MSIRRRKFLATIPMSSMADIAFLLLVFFMVTSVLKVDAEIPLTLPEGTGKQIKDTRDLRVSITKEGGYWLGNITYPLADLSAHIRAEIAKDPELTVLINADRDLDFEIVKEFFETLKEIGVTNIGIVTQRQKS